MPAELFFEMLKTNNPRLLLVTSDYPDFIPIDLPPLRENIVLEYETLTKDNSYSAYKEDINETGRDLNYINRLKAIYQLMILGDDRMIDELEVLDFQIDKITPNEILRLKNLIELEQTKIEIYFLRHKEDNTDDDEKRDEFNFLAILTRLSNFFQRQIPRDIVVTEFVFLINDAKEISKSKKDGRSNKF